MRKFRLLPFIKSIYRLIFPEKKLRHGLGCMQFVDALSIYRSLDIIAKRFQNDKILRVCEVGVRNGDTGRGLARFLKLRGHDVEYWGVDNGADGFLFKPFSTANMIWEDSVSAHEKLPDDFHWIFVDGCHCAEHATKDITNYGKKVRVGGVLVMHDIAPHRQGQEYQGHGNPEDKHSAIWVREPMQSILKTHDWALEFEDWTEGAQGGVAVYTRRSNSFDNRSEHV